MSAKRVFDFVVALIGLLLTWWIIAICFLAATIETGKVGFFTQIRIGRGGRKFKLIKIRTMKDVTGYETSVTTARDVRITRSGRFFRRTKLDELPQLINVLVGQMSIVGPRPDVPGFADQLRGEDRLVLSVRPGITGPASLRFRNEEELLAGCEDPERYNREIIYPEKVKINKEYVATWSFRNDLRYILLTILGRQC